MKRFAIATVAVCLIAVTVIAAAGEQSDEWDLSGITKIKLDGVSGDIIIRPAEGRTGRLELRAHVRPEDSFSPVVNQSNGTLKIKEKFRGNSNGDLEWTIYLPERGDPMRISIHTASGALECSGVKADISFETASGDIELEEVNLAEGSSFNTASGDFILNDMTITEDCSFNTASGDFELENLVIEEGCTFSTASGDIKCSGCKCEDDVDFSSASGNVVVKDSRLRGMGDFSSASGDVSMHFAELPEGDLSASSASGDVYLAVDDFGDDFTLILIKRQGKGRISCPFEYTSEETFEDYHTYEKKIVKRGSGRPEIELRTASGKVVVKD